MGQDRKRPAEGGRREGVFDSTELRVIGALIAALVAFLVFAVVMASREDDRYARWCEAQGGHVDSTTKTVTTIGANGKPGIGSTTTTFCLSSDGRILDVR